MKTYPLHIVAEILEEVVDDDNPVSRISVDSHDIHGEDLFFALKGQRVDGHRFVSLAAEKGATAAIVSEMQDVEVPQIVVQNPLQALQQFASHVLKEWNPRTVAVTGSVGKTTTKEFIATLLEQKYSVASSKGNHNSQVGLPLAICNDAKGDEEILTLEMGMSQAGEIKKLTKVAPPEIAVVTNVELVHAEFFDGVEGIAAAKGEIFSQEQTRIGIIEHSLKKYFIDSHCDLVTFSVVDEDADFFLEEYDGKVVITAPKGRGILHGGLPVPGKHNQSNFLASVVVARAMGLSWAEVQSGMRHLKLPKQRLQPVEKKGVLFINDAYNACSVSMKAALECLPEPKKGGKRIAVLGEMTELGKFSDECHHDVGEHALEYVEEMFCLGNGCAPIHKIWEKSGRPVYWENDRSKLIERLRTAINTGDVVLIKGSQSTDIWKVVDEL